MHRYQLLGSVSDTHTCVCVCMCVCVCVCVCVTVCLTSATEPLTAEEEADSGAASMLSVSLGENDNRTALSVHSKESYKDHSSSSTSSNGNKQQRLKHSMTVSAVIKLHYDTTDPIYNAIRQLILKFVLRWIMPGYHSNRPGAVQQRLTTPSPSMLAPLEESFVPKGSDLMRDTWFTSRDNVNLLFEIFHKVQQKYTLTVCI